MPKGGMRGKLAALGAAWEPYLRTIATTFGAPTTPPIEQSVFSWLDRLVEWNARIDLTAARDAGELADLMLADAAFLARHVAPNERLVDIGSGAGGPGLGFALFRPDVETTLVEPMQKRTSFLRTAVGAAGGKNVRLVRARGQDVVIGVSPSAGAPWDCAVARATLPPPEWLALGSRLVRPGGSVWVLLAREPSPSAPGMRLVHEENYVWPHTGAERRAARYERNP